MWGGNKMVKKKIKKQIKSSSFKKRLGRKANKKGLWNYLKTESSFKKLNWKVFIVSLIVVAIVAYIGSTFTNVGTWYESIKPSIAPPNWVFPIVWTVLFYLIAVSLYYSWIDNERKNKKKVIVYYGINFVLNILWSYLFFKMQSPRFALLEIFILWLSIFVLIGFNWRKSRKAAYFLIPYLIWVSFAIILNYFAIQ
jgi:translocator protein